MFVDSTLAIFNAYNGIKTSTKFVQLSELYFGMKNGNENKSWEPHVLRGTCQSELGVLDAR